MNQRKQIVLSFDIEDWFCVRNMQHLFPFEKWDSCELRVDIGTEFILEELDKRKIKGTFFILGSMAEKKPEMVKKIANAGHEIATHGYSHRSIELLSPEEFRKELKTSIEILSSLSGKCIRGHRAPNFSITPETYWALDILKEEKIVYDSSIYPVALYPKYGVRGFNSDNHQLPNGLVEVPMSSANIFGVRFPVSGGGLFRLLPYAFYKKLLFGALENRTCLLYFHPWEFDCAQPRVDLPLIKRFRHYTGLRENRANFQKLLNDLADCEFVTIEALLKIQCLD